MISNNRAASAALAPLLCALAVLLTLLAPAPAFAQPPTDSTDTSAPELQRPSTPEPAPAPAPQRETNCSDGEDDDGDTVYDCGDHDCHADPVCQPDGQPEIGEARCGDWVDNDNDGFTDCDDVECEGTQACMGSWDRELQGERVGTLESSDVRTGTAGATIELQPGQAPEDLLFKAGDSDGERDNYTCNDGFDNDNDGFVDCDDLGCKLNTEVTICQPSGNFRFSVVARVAQTFNLAGPEFGDRAPIQQPGGNDPADPRQAENRSLFNTEFETLQLRVLGQLPFIQNSFFLISARAEKTPRITFATFQVPIKNGHYFNINSGGGGLSLELVRSVSKRLMVDPAFYVYNAFEQGNGAALEFGGPLSKNGKFLYRAFLAGGSGRFAGNVGGTFFPDGDRNFTWTGGAQVHMNLVGYYNRFDSPFLYVPVPTTFALTIGAKYDQRAQERYPAANIQAVFRWKRIVLLGEVYGKRELNFKNWQLAFNVQAGVLAVKRRLLLAADFGQYLATPFEDPPEDLGSDLRRQLTELQWRVVAHVFLWRDVLVLSTVFRDRFVERAPSSQIPEGTDRRTDLRVLLMYRF